MMAVNHPKWLMSLVKGKTLKFDTKPNQSLKSSSLTTLKDSRFVSQELAVDFASAVSAMCCSVIFQRKFRQEASMLSWQKELKANR